MCSRLHGSSILQKSTVSIPTTSFHTNLTICDSRKSYLDTRKSTKWLPRPHLDAPGALLGRQRRPKESPRSPQEVPEGCLEGPRGPKRSPRGRQGVPKGSPRGPQEVAKGSPRGPKGSQGVPKGAKGSPRAPKGVPAGRWNAGVAIKLSKFEI